MNERHIFNNEGLEKISRDIGVGVGTLLAKLAIESERSAVIIGAARLDNALESLLKSVLQSCPGGNDDLFDQDRPLSSFSAKIALCYRMGLIDRDFEHALQMVRKMRNDFAHSIETESLKDNKQVGRLNEAVRRAIEHPIAPIIFENIKKIVDKDLHSFCLTLALMIVSIELVDIINTRTTVVYPASFDKSVWNKISADAKINDIEHKEKADK